MKIIRVTFPLALRLNAGALFWTKIDQQNKVIEMLSLYYFHVCVGRRRYFVIGDSAKTEHIQTHTRSLEAFGNH